MPTQKSEPSSHETFWGEAAAACGNHHGPTSPPRPAAHGLPTRPGLAKRSVLTTTRGSELRMVGHSMGGRVCYGLDLDNRMTCIVEMICSGGTSYMTREIAEPVGEKSRTERSIENTIIIIRGEKVILDSDLAGLYGVETRRLNEQVRRNRRRFPQDFMFQLTQSERDDLKSHFATSRQGWGGRRKLPFAFTEHGAIMAASVLNTERAVEMSIFVVRAFVRLRSFLSAHKELAARVTELERRLTTHDEHILAIIDAIRRLMTEPETTKKKKIGFLRNGER